MRRALLAATLLAAVLAAAPAQASAPWVAQYLVGVAGGRQQTSWTLSHADAGASDVSQDGKGSRPLRFVIGTTHLRAR